MSNPLRTCIGCTQTDDHPRHVIDVGGGDVVTFHMDCHVIATGCEICAAQTSGAKSAKGDKLREHLLKTGPGDDQPGWTAPSDEQVRAELKEEAV